VLHPGDLSPAALSAWLARGRAGAPSARGRIDLDGLSRIPRLLEDLLGPRPTAPPPRASRAEVHHAA
jgi:predicted glycosyltransferase